MNSSTMKLGLMLLIGVFIGAGLIYVMPPRPIGGTPETKTTPEVIDTTQVLVKIKQ